MTRSSNCKTVVVDLVQILTSDVYVYLCCYACYCESVTIELYFIYCMIQLAIMSITRRRRLLNDEVLTSLAESSWEILDISGSDVTDAGLATVANVCSNLRAVDIR